MAAGPKPVVVITGASSGLGRATAHAFAAEGAAVVLVARSHEALTTVAAELNALGAAADTYAIDVGDAAAVQNAASQAVARFGRIDIWINCAAVLALGRFEEVPAEAFARVIETNVLGYANGARAALLQFRAQGGHGVLINVGSVLGGVTEPFASAYVTSKFAIRGLSAVLRQEVADTPGIRVCAVLPAALDTPIYQHAANYTRRTARALIPIYDPRRAAKRIVRLARSPKPEIVIGGFGRLLLWASKLTPRLLEKVIAKVAPGLQFTDEPHTPSGGNLFGPAPSSQDAVTGGWRERWLRQLFGRGK